jgi:Ca2+-dependent lipid-binding protein
MTSLLMCQLPVRIKTTTISIYYKHHHSIMDTEENVCLVIEIQSCRSLLSEDRNGLSDPYVKIKMGKTLLHETKHILRTLNPVFTEKDKNQYLLDLPSKEVSAHGGIQFKLKDRDRMSSDDDLGTVNLSAQELSAITTEKTLELPVTPPPKRSLEDAGYLTIHCRPAEAGEKELLSSKKKKTTIRKGSSSLLGSLTKRSKKEISEYDPADLPPDDRHIFIQVKSCHDLLAADKTGYSDPYVKIKFGGGGKDLHKTKYQIQTLNPNFDVVTDESAFILDVQPKEVFENGGLEFKIKDWDKLHLGANDDLGSVRVPAKALYQSSWEKEFKIDPPEGKEDTEAGYITIIVREATNLDKESLRKENMMKHSLLSKIDIGE